jgi:outer membrane protein assembly factor BamA
MILAAALAMLPAAMSCKTARMLPQDEQLLKRSRITGSTGRIGKEKLEPFIKQKPNKKMLGFMRFRLLLYNMARGGQKGRFQSWMADKAGEPPVPFDSLAAQSSAASMENYLRTRGYYDARVQASHKTNSRRNAKVKYEVFLGMPYYIRNNMVNIADSAILAIVAGNMRNSHVLEGAIFDIEMLRREQERISAAIREQGYWAFGTADLFYQADSTVGYRQVDLYLHIPMRQDDNGERNLPHKKYFIRNTYVVPNFDFRQAAGNRSLFLQQADSSLAADNIYFLNHGKPYVRQKTVLRGIFVNNGEVYKASDALATQKKLSANKLFRMVRVDFTELSSPDADSAGMLDCYVMLTPFKAHSYSIDLEGSSTDGDYGGKIRLSYSHKNLLGGSENLSLDLSYARKGVKTLDQRDDAMINIFNAREYGIDLKLETPHFIAPFAFERIQKNLSPHTIIRGGYNFEKNYNFTSPQTYISYGYTWRRSPKAQFTFNPSEISGLRYYDLDSVFIDYVRSNPYYRASYQSYLITAINFGIIASSQEPGSARSYAIHRISAETAGNMLNIIPNSLDDSDIQLLKAPKAQYLKLDYDFRYYASKEERRQTVFRLMGGCAWPYGSRKTMPSIKQYSSGGLNSMRAWPARTLGPGSYNGSNEGDSNIKYYLGDIKIEANAEHRFKLFWHLDGAVFIDAGNIWTFYEDENRPGTQFDLRNFAGQIAAGGGLGIRLDLDFFVFRVDGGVKLRDPSRSGNKWIITQGIGNNDWNMNFGIGYPF